VAEDRPCQLRAATGGGDDQPAFCRGWKLTGKRPDLEERLSRTGPQESRFLLLEHMMIVATRRSWLRLWRGPRTSDCCYVLPSTEWRHPRPAFSRERTQ
jgi:hypothetical protein